MPEVLPEVISGTKVKVHTKVPITVAYGDGIGPEIMAATLRILNAANAALEIEEIEVGEKVYLRGNSAGINSAAWDSLRKTKVLLKAPVTTPQGGGYKSINVTMRKMLGLYANVRPCLSYHPYVQTKHPIMDVVIIRENEEDVYGGIEHQQTDEVVQCLKLITRPGTERIIRYAFEYARVYGRKKVTCFTKDNIMKLTDGLFHRVFNEVGTEYPDIAKEHMIVDIGAAKLADTPEHFDVIVMPNLYGDILSDVAAQITGSVGLAGSANIGDGFAMFEAIHGSAPDIAGTGKANPSGLLLAAIQMLVHIGQGGVAELIHNAWLKTLEDGIHTYDIYKPGSSSKAVGTAEFADEVIARLGELPYSLTAAKYDEQQRGIEVKLTPTVRGLKELVGVDIFLHCAEITPDALAEQLLRVDERTLKLVMISNRGTKVWPNGFPETFCTDHWRCRFLMEKPQGISFQVILDLQQRMLNAGLSIIKTENLYLIDGKPCFSAGQGQ